MKIAIIGAQRIPVKHKKTNKPEEYCEELYARVAQRGHKINWFIQPRLSKQTAFSVSYYRRMRMITLFSLPGKKLDFWHNSALNTIWATLTQHDVVHFHNLKSAWFAWFIKLFSDAKVIVTCQQIGRYQGSQSKFLSWLLQKIEKATVNSADELVVNSKILGTYFEQKYNIVPRYIPNAPRRYKPTDGKFAYGRALGLDHKRYILYLGKLEPEQSLDLLIQAFQIVQPPGWKLVIAGEIGAYTEYVTQLIKTAKKLDSIIFVNEIRGYSLAEVIRAAGLLVAPARESDMRFLLPILEAMREGTPILASDTEVHQELLGRDRGLLFNSEQLDSLIDQLTYATSESARLQATVKRAQTYVAINHGWDRVLYKNLFLYLNDWAIP